MRFRHQSHLKTRKKSRYRYITPVLLLRTEEDREKLISEKVSSILAQNVLEAVLYCKSEHQELLSKNLSNQWRNDTRIFKLSSYETDNCINNDIFYVKSLNISPTKHKCGSLLRDWSNIPGREKSPIPNYAKEMLVTSGEDTNDTSNISCLKGNIAINISENTLVQKNNQLFRTLSSRSISPELFESDDEMVVEIPEQKLPQNVISLIDEDSSQSLLISTPTNRNKMVNINTTKEIDDVVNVNSQSLLSMTSPKKRLLLNNSVLETGEISLTSPLLKYKSKKLPFEFLEDNVHGNGDDTDMDGGTTSLLSNMSKISDNNDKVFVDGKDIDRDNVTPPLLWSETKNSSFQILTNESKNKSTSFEFGEDNVVVSDNGICSFECFTSEPVICYDLSYSSDENEKNGMSTNDTDATHKYVQPDRNQALPETISPVISRTKCDITLLSTVADTTQKSDCFLDETVSVYDDKNLPGTSRQNQSLNITDYVDNILNEYQTSLIHQAEGTALKLEQNTEEDQNNVFDLTQSSTDSSCCFEKDQKIGNTTTKICQKDISDSEVDDTLPPVQLKNSKFAKHDSFKSTTSDDVNLSQGSQESLCISDEELNYSSVYGTPGLIENRLSIHEDDSDNINNTRDILKVLKNSIPDDTDFNVTPKTLKESNLKDIEAMCNFDSPSEFSEHSNFVADKTILQHPRITHLSCTSVAKSRKSLFEAAETLNDSINAAEECNDVQILEEVPSTSKQPTTPNQTIQPDNSNTTPKSEVIIKTDNVTPMTNYKEMDTPKIVKELQKFGLKPLKRQRGVQILQHIYESTHPLVYQNRQHCEQSESDDENRIVKRRKSNSSMKATSSCRSPNKQNRHNVTFSNNRETFGIKGIESLHERSIENKIEIVGDLMHENETIENLIFEKKQPSKIASCRVPLHIAWHNLLSSQPELKKNILLYEPLQLEVLYNLLKDQGYKYHIQDLLTFLDKKCITIRTNQNSHRTIKQRKRSISPKKRK